MIWQYKIDQYEIVRDSASATAWTYSVQEVLQLHFFVDLNHMQKSRNWNHVDTDPRWIWIHTRIRNHLWIWIYLKCKIKDKLSSFCLKLYWFDSELVDDMPLLVDLDSDTDPDPDLWKPGSGIRILKWPQIWLRSRIQGRNRNTSTLYHCMKCEYVSFYNISISTRVVARRSISAPLFSLVNKLNIHK